MFCLLMMKAGDQEVSETLMLQLEDEGVKKEPDQLLSKKKEVLALLPVSGE